MAEPEKYPGGVKVRPPFEMGVANLIEEDQKQMDDEEFRKYRDKVFRIAALGEEQGFVRGFRFAFQLFIECMNEKEP